MPSPPKARPDETLLRCHFTYEINMLCQTYHLCKDEVSKTADERTKMLNNAIIESFCLHARNLIEFLGKSYVSEIYTDQAYKYQREETMYSRISAQITHLVYDGKYQRAILEEEKIGLEERANILNSLAHEVEKFKNRLSQAFSHVAIPIPVRVSASKRSFMGTTTTTTPTTITVSSFPPKPEG